MKRGPLIGKWVKSWLPPNMLGMARRLRGAIGGGGYRYLGPTWPSQTSGGWSSDDVVAPRRRLFEAWRRTLAGSYPLTDEWPPRQRDALNVDDHNRYMIAAYGFAVAAAGKRTLSVLDWGGACADYLLLAERLVPGVAFNWHCVEVAEICKLGREVNGRARFYDDDGWRNGQYDLAFSSSAIQYAPDWRELVRQLAGASREWIFITRIPVVLAVPSYVFVQHAPQYHTSYPGWVFNRDDLVAAATASGFTLFREFLLGGWSPIYGAPEQAMTMGFMLRRA